MIRNRLILLCSLLCTMGLWACDDSDEETDAGVHDHDDHGDGDHGDGDHGDGDHGDGDHAHDACGLAENCLDDAVEPEASTTIDVDGYEVMFHMVDGYTMYGDDIPGNTALQDTWMIMLHDGDGNPVADTDIAVGTYSEDCLHYGPGGAAAEELTTNESGMVTVNPVFAHGGPWTVRIDIGADGEEGDEEIKIDLCVPGEAHGGGDHSEHDADADGDHSGHES